ncbi:MAG: efflux RND transporter periplasmic adaptor subunit [Flavobacteriales bacterium]
MKRTILIALPFVLLLSACSSEEPDKKTELQKLEKEYADLGSKIQKLREEIAKEGKSDAELNARAIAFTEIQPAVFTHTIDVLGLIEGEENVVVTAEMPGTVLRVSVSVGARVSKGQILAELENGTMLQSYEEVKNQRDFAQTMYDKQKRLWDQNIGSEVQYLSAKNNLDALNNRLATIQEQIEMSRLRSPINGTVDQVDIKAGQMLAPGMPGISVVNTSRLKLTAEMAESYITKVKSGSTVIVNVPDANKEFTTKVKYSGQAVNKLNRTFNIDVLLNAKEAQGLFPNMSAKIRIVDYENKEAFVLPVAAVLKTDKGDKVFIAVQEKGKWKARATPVKLGVSYNSRVEVLEGLKKGDKVITTGQLAVTDGEYINFGK